MESKVDTQASGQCIECRKPADVACHYCKEYICKTHIWESRFMARQFMGPYMIPYDVIVCEACYGERVCLGWRAVFTILALLMATSAITTFNIHMFVVLTLGVVGNWILTGTSLRKHRAHKEQRTKVKPIETKSPLS